MRAVPFAIAGAILVAGCGRSKSPPSGAATITSGDGGAPATADPRTPGTPVRAGSVRQPIVVDGYAVVVPAGGDVAATEAAMRAAAATAPDHITMDVTRGTIADVRAEVDLVEYFGRGLGEADLAGLRAAKDVVGVSGGGQAAAVAEVSHRAAAVARVGAARAGGWIVDLPSGFIFSPAELDKVRTDGFPLDGDELVAIHAVSEDDGTAFLETFGLGRFGLPELYMRGIPRSFGDDMVELVKAAVQELIERGAVGAGVLDVDLARLTTPPWPANLAALRAHGGTGKVRFAATWTLGDQHDEERPPEIELTLPGGPPAEQIHAARIAFFGSEPDQMVQAADDDPRLLAARDRARKELAALAPRFARGVPELEQLLVKAPFATDAGGVEWMWVEVHVWKGDRLSGVLVNQPDDVAHLKEGARVEVKQGELFDYLLHEADGTDLGGETNRILEGP